MADTIPTGSLFRTVGLLPPRTTTERQGTQRLRCGAAGNDQSRRAAIGDFRTFGRAKSARLI